MFKAGFTAFSADKYACFVSVQRATLLNEAVDQSFQSDRQTDGLPSQGRLHSADMPDF
jgi:hypothetical protein